jgi:hypothetical protein
MLTIEYGLASRNVVGIEAMAQCQKSAICATSLFLEYLRVVKTFWHSEALNLINCLIFSDFWSHPPGLNRRPADYEIPTLLVCY